MEKVVIVGAGIIGFSVAYELSKRGYDITIIDRTGPGHGCSYGNAGMLVPSHFETLPAPGVIQKALRWLTDAQGPFSINPSVILSDPGFLLKFAGNCNESHVERHRNLLKTLHTISRDVYLEWSQELDDFKLETNGISMLFGSEKGEKEEKQLGEKAIDLGMPVEFLTRSQLEEREPGLQMRVKGGVHYNLDAQLNPGKLMQALKAELIKRGVHLEYNFSMDRFLKGTNGIKGVKADREIIEGDQFVLAAGTWSGDLVRSLGINLPLQSGKGYSFNVPDQNGRIRIPKLINEAKATITPMGGFVRFGGTMQLGNRKEGITMNRIRGLYKSLEHYFPNFSFPEFNRLNPWYGFRPVSPDGLPYLGRLRKYPNLFIAAGHAMIGISLGAVTGRIAAQLLSGEDPGIDIRSLDPERMTHSRHYWAQ